MKLKLGTVVLIALVVLALGACQGEHATVTGGYGTNVVSGEVSVTGVANTSPAGVQVSVRGTGMAMTLGADGRFTFVDVPSGAQLDFSRAEDGINASMAVEQNATAMSIALTQTTAKKSSKRRAGGKTTEKIYEFEGVIRAAAADSITVYTSHKEEVTIGLLAETVIRKGDAIVTPAELLVDTRVHVKAKSVSDAWQAVLVIVQKDDDGDDDGGVDDGPAVVTEYEGTVRSSALGSLVVFTSHQQEVTFALTAATIIRKGNTPVLATDIHVGDRVHVKATTDATTNVATASQVIVQKTETKPGKSAKISGAVLSVGTDSLSVQTSAGPVTVTVSATTKIEKDHTTITLAGIAVGDSVKAEGTKVDATTFAAKKIEVGTEED